MDKKTKIFFWVFSTLIAGVVVVTFCKYIILKDYYIEAEADCDPASQACFVTTCDPADDSECPADEADRTSYTKKVKKKAYLIPLCDPSDENCDALKCIPGEDCQETFCNEETVGEGQECNDPVKYLEEKAATKDDSVICEEGDDTCQAEGGDTASDDSGQDQGQDSSPSDAAN
jgi:hypothetical protein